VRGTKLTAWRIPPAWKDLQENNFIIPENSGVPQNQKKMLKATVEVLTAIAKDVRGGLLETVGVESSFSMDDGRCSVVLELPVGTDTELVARAIDLENVEAWRDDAGKVHVGINPWYSTKDVDQTVLCTIKVIHVLLGIHATDTEQPKTFKQKLLSSVADIMAAQKGVAKRKD
jgi:D-Tyr-tRNAtyr deacylase